MTAAEVQEMPIVDRVRKIKVLTPGQYQLHSWLDLHPNNGALIDNVLLTVAAGGKLVSGVPE